MKKVYLILLVLFSFKMSAQKVYSVKYENQADLKVYKVKYQNQADKKIYLVKYANQADLKIYFVKYENQAGWNDKSKMQLMY